MTRVSIVIPTHNRPELLRRALTSVFDQTLRDFEVIVVDDGDNPRAEDVVASFASLGEVIYLETKKNEGGSATRNYGIRRAVGEYVAFLDDDDEWLPNKLDTQVALLDGAPEGVGFVFSAVNNIHPDHTEVTPVDPSLRDYRRIALIRFNGFMTSGLLVRRSVFHDIGMFDESLPSHQEADLMLRVAQKYEGIGTKEAYVNMYISSHDDHIGGNVDRRIAGRELVLKKHSVLLQKHPELLARHYFWLALQYRSKGDYTMYAKACLRAYRLGGGVHMLPHVCVGAVRGVYRYMKAYIYKKILRPAHFGLMLRLMYFKKYVPGHIMKGHVAVLDAGCGRGRFTEYLATLNPRASIRAVDLVRQKEWSEYAFEHVTFETLDLTTYDEEEKRDFIMSVDVLEHIRGNREVVKRLARGLKSGGYLYMAVPCDQTSPHIFPTEWFASFHEWEKDEHVGEQPTLEEWKDTLRSLGIDIVTARYTFTMWGTFAWEVEYLLSLRPRCARLNILLMPVYRLLALLDMFLPIGKGNNLILGRKK